MPPTADQKTEVRQLGLPDVAAIVIGGIIGVGIFFTPATVAAEVPSPTWVLGVWILGGAIAMLGALALAEMGARVPESGGVYVFLRDGLPPRISRLTAFLYAWINLLVLQPLALAIIALVLVFNLEFLIGALPEPLHTATEMLAIAVFVATNVAGLKTGASVQRWVTAAKLVAVAFLVVLGMAWGGAQIDWTAPQSAPTGGPLAIVAAALIPVLFSYGGWQHGTFVAGVTRNPQRNVPWGIVGGVIIVVIAYATINYGYLRLLGQEGMAGTSALAAEASAAVLGEAGGKAVAFAIVLSAAGILNTILLAFPYVIFAMARDGLFFDAFGRLHPRTGTPVWAILLPGCMACVAVFLGADRIDMLLAGVAFGEWAFFALAAVALFGLRRRDPDHTGFQAPTWVAVAFIVVATAVAIGALIVKPAESAVGVAALVVGAGLYSWKRIR